MLTHYTSTSYALVNILTHGFAWFPNRRHLTRLLIPEHDFTKREPQQFGMISFTEMQPEEAEAHREQFGSYGIIVSGAWSGRNAALPVIYVNEFGPLTEALKAIFDIGYKDVTARIRYPGDEGWLMAYENKFAAGAIAGSRLWANLLQLWEYMEPEGNSNQREYRIVNPDPFYSLSTDKAEVIKSVSPPEGWGKHTRVLAIQRADVVALVCPAGERRKLRAILPSEYVDVQIREVGRRSYCSPMTWTSHTGL